MYDILLTTGSDVIAFCLVGKATTKRFKNLDRCIRRYRYSGSFLNYVFRTLQYAGRGFRPLYAFSLHDPVAFGSAKYKIENLYKDAETMRSLFIKERSIVFRNNSY